VVVDEKLSGNGEKEKHMERERGVGG